MGNSLCCSHQTGIINQDDDMIPIDTKRKFTPTRNGQSDQILSTRLNAGDKQQLSARGKKLPQSNVNNSPYIAFELQQHFPISFMSFSQRKFPGYRNKYEFDKKRLVVSSEKEYMVIGYDHQKNVYELMRSIVSMEEQIKFISFLEDNVPQFIFIITENSKENITYFKIMKLKKNQNYLDSSKIEETKTKMKQQILEKVKDGHFKNRRKRNFGNTELIPNKDVKIELRRTSSDVKLRKGSVLQESNFSNLQHQSSNIANSGILNNDSQFKNTIGDVDMKGLEDDQQLVMLEDQNSKNYKLQYNLQDKFEQTQELLMQEKAEAKKQSGLSMIEEMNELDSPFTTEEFGKLQVTEKVVKSFLFNNPVGTYLFTIEESNKLSIYLIKSYINADQLVQNGTNFLKKSKISNFRMAKRATLELEFRPKQIEFFGDYFLIIYKRFKKEDTPGHERKPSNLTTNYVPFIDIVEKSGRPISRIDIDQILRNHSLVYKRLSRVKFTRLQWSQRKIEEFEMSKNTVLKKTIVTGECTHEDKERPFIIKMNLETQEPEVIKILRIEDRISCIGYGPYDNGYLILGMKSGLILIFDVIQLDKIQSVNVFQSPVQTLAFEPTNLIFAGSQQGDVAAFTILQKELHYVYLDLGKKNYCTVALPTQNNTEQNMPSNGSLFCL